MLNVRRAGFDVKRSAFGSVRPNGSGSWEWHPGEQVVSGRRIRPTHGPTGRLQYVSEPVRLVWWPAREHGLGFLGTRDTATARAARCPDARADRQRPPRGSEVSANRHVHGVKVCRHGCEVGDNPRSVPSGHSPPVMPMRLRDLKRIPSSQFYPVPGRPHLEHSNLRRYGERPGDRLGVPGRILDEDQPYGPEVAQRPRRPDKARERRRGPPVSAMWRRWIGRPARSRALLLNRVSEPAGQIRIRPGEIRRLASQAMVGLADQESHKMLMVSRQKTGPPPVGWRRGHGSRHRSQLLGYFRMR